MLLHNGCVLNFIHIWYAFCSIYFVPVITLQNIFLIFFREVWKGYYSNRNLRAFSVQPLLVYPTHYTGEENYISDTEDSEIAASVTRDELWFYYQLNLCMCFVQNMPNLCLLLVKQLKVIVEIISVNAITECLPDV